MILITNNRETIPEPKTKTKPSNSGIQSIPKI